MLDYKELTASTSHVSLQLWVSYEGKNSLSSCIYLKQEKLTGEQSAYFLLV